MKEDFKKVATTAERIREALTIKDMKQVDLSNKTGIDKGSISSYVSGRYEPKNEAVMKIANCLGVDEMWLWGYDAPMIRKPRSEEKMQEAKERADFDVMIAKNEDVREMLQMFMALPEDKKKTVKQMVVDYYNAFANGR